jgi:hypothetical protein
MKRATAFWLVCCGSSAWAYVPQTTPSGSPVEWPSGCVVLTPDRDGPRGVSPAAAQQAIAAAARDWITAVGGSSALQIAVLPPEPSSGAARDGKNTVTWLHDRWGRSVNGEFVPYDPEATAVTTVYYLDHPHQPDDGHIVEIDIELNDVNFAFGRFEDGPRPGVPCVMDIENTLSHELGHAIGFEHTCWTGGAPHAIDEHGDPTPACGLGLPNPIVDSALFNFTGCFEIKKRSPQPDDVAGVVALYAGAPRGTCDQRVRPESFAARDHTAGGCAFVSGPQSTAGPWLLAVCAAGLTARARRSGRRTRARRRTSTRSRARRNFLGQGE